MSLSKPEINYDTALYALQENVVLKQRLEEDKQQYIKRLEEEEKKYADLLYGMQNLRHLERATEEKLGKALDDVRCLNRSLDIRTKQRDRARSWNRVFNFSMMAFLLVDFIISVWLFCQIPFGVK